MLNILQSLVAFFKDDKKRSSFFGGSAAVLLLLTAVLPFSVLVKLPFIIIFSAMLVIHVFKLLFERGMTYHFINRQKQGERFDFRKKSAADEENLSSIFLRIGLILAVIVVILAFNWKSYDKIAQLQGQLGDLEDMQIEPPQTQHKKKKPPPPKVEKIEEVEEEEIEDEPEIQETEATEDMAVDIPDPPEEPDEPEIFTIVEDMPEFPGGQEKLLEYIYDHIKYPPMAKENDVEGVVVVQFVVRKNGDIDQIEVLRDIGAGCGEEAVRVVKNMPNWKPGKQRGKPVPVYFKLPIRFDLQ